ITGATQLGHDRDAPLAERGVLAARADVLAARPAALALPTARAVDADDETRDVLALVRDARARVRAIERHARHDEDRRQQGALGAQQRWQVFRGARDAHRGLEPAADQLLGPRGLQRLRDFTTDL